MTINFAHCLINCSIHGRDIGMEEKFSLESFYQQYQTDTSELVINGRKFNILLPVNISQFINNKDVLHDFPLWTKIWPASWVLASHLAQMPVSVEKEFLEIGGGAGTVSIVATAFGHHITMTDYDADALRFARANAIINECPGLSIRHLDWNRPQLTGQFDYIVASEVCYKKEDIDPLLMLFKNSLKAGGEVLLAAEMRAISNAYYKALETLFDIRSFKKTLRSDSEEIAIFILRMTLKGAN